MRIAIVGAGISGLTCAAHLLESAREKALDLDLTIVEAADRVGGHAWTVCEEGFLVEGGPNGFLDREREPEPRRLIRILGLDSRVIEANPAAKRRFVLRRGKPCLVPDGPASLLTTRVLSPAGKLRLMMEPWAPKAPSHDETVFEFARRRIGREAAEVLVDAAISGISAGDSRVLSVSSAFPIMKEMERDHGSLIRAMMARRGQKPARLVSFDGGMATLIDALRERCEGRLRTGVALRELSRDGDDWRLGLSDGNHVAVDRVVLALPARDAAPAVEGLDSELARTMASFRYSSLAMVALAYREADTGPLDGYGYLVPALENLETIGVLWESSVFAGRAPAGHVLLRVMIGGARRPEIARLDSNELQNRARRELKQVMGITAAPLRCWVRRWPDSIPQYDFGQALRMADVRRRVGEKPGLEICGTSYDGIAFGAAIASGAAAARRVLADAALRTGAQVS